jgi:hypothetical protein
MLPDADPASVAFRRVHNLNEDNITVVKQVRISLSNQKNIVEFNPTPPKKWILFTATIFNHTQKHNKNRITD